MLQLPKPRRKPAARQTFRAGLWGDDHPDFQCIDATLASDHHARWLRTVVAHLDLTAFRLSYAGYGSLAYPVELLIAFVLFLYSQGVLTPAAWARRAGCDDECKWLLRGLRPSRSQLYTFRDRVEPFLDDWHKQLIAWAVLEGITKATRGSLDGTFVAALASRFQLMSVRRVDRRLLLLQLLVGLEGEHAANGDLAVLLAPAPALLGPLWLLFFVLLYVGCTPPLELVQMLLSLLALRELLNLEEGKPWQLPVWVPPTPVGRKRVLVRYENAQQRLEQRLAPLLEKKKLSKKDEQTIKHLKVSLTDPDAALGWDKLGTFRPLYNVPLVQATDTNLTLAWDVVAQSNDEGLVIPMMEKTKEQLGHYLNEMLVDGAFVSVGEVVWCESKGIIPYSPPKKAEKAKEEVLKAESEKSEKTNKSNTEDEKRDSGKEDQSQPSNGPAKKQEKLPKEAFRYDSEEEVYYCPQGKRLPEFSRTTVKRQNGIELPMIVHRASGEDCQACPQKHNCTSNPKKGRVVKRYEGEEALDRLEQRMQEPANQEVYKLRKRSVELGYADLKQHRGLRVFRSFGRKRARAQAGLVILASNGLKIMRALQRRETAQPPPSTQEKQSA